MRTIMKGCSVGAMLAVLAAAAVEKEFRVIFDGTAGTGWILCDKKPLPKDNVQPDGLNPHGTGSYLVVHETKFGDFVLEFDYKLTKGCNSGVFIRVSDLKDPVPTGIEVAIDDTSEAGMHDSGAFYDLVAPKENAQRPAGEWNHMTITARGPKMTVTLNDKEVSTINLDEWNEPGKRADGSKHKFDNVAIGKLPRTGYLGFQDHGSDCWFKNVKIKELD
jgi:Domain of Unknown Function (DUF1080)